MLHFGTYRLSSCFIRYPRFFLKQVGKVPRKCPFQPVASCHAHPFHTCIQTNKPTQANRACQLMLKQVNYETFSTWHKAKQDSTFKTNTLKCSWFFLLGIVINTAINGGIHKIKSHHFHLPPFDDINTYKHFQLLGTLLHCCLGFAAKCKL